MNRLTCGVNFITGIMLGIEHVDLQDFETDGFAIVIDILFVRFTLTYERGIDE